MAAIAVVFHHLLLAFYPAIIFGIGAVQHTHFEDNIHGTPLAIIFAGTFAVAIFFVLSGFVLSVGFFQTKDEKIIKKLASKRYLRLMLPALAVTMLSFLCIKLGFVHYITEMAKVTQSDWLSGGSWNASAHFIQALYSGTIGIFVEGNSPFDNVLWTMITEFSGSFIVFGFALLFGTSKHRWVSYIILGVFTFNTWYLPFILGMVLADLYTSGKLEALRKKKWIISALIGAVIFGAYPIAGVQTTPYHIISNQLFANFTINYSVLYLTLGAVLLIFAVLVSQRLSTWLEKPKVSNLGKYTFSLYLIHLPILYTVGSVVFLVIHKHAGYNMTVLITLALIAPVIIAATILFERYIDAPSVKFAGIVARIFETGDAFPIRKYALKVRRRLRKYGYAVIRRPLPEELPVE